MLHRDLLLCREDMTLLAELRERCPSAHLYYKHMLQSQSACEVETQADVQFCTMHTRKRHITHLDETGIPGPNGRQHNFKASSSTCSNTKCNAVGRKRLRAFCRRTCRSKIINALTRMLTGCGTYFGDSVCKCRSLETEQERLSWLHSPHDQSTNHPPTGA